MTDVEQVRVTIYFFAPVTAADRAAPLFFPLRRDPAMDFVWISSKVPVHSGPMLSTDNI